MTTYEDRATRYMQHYADKSYRYKHLRVSLVIYKQRYRNNFPLQKYGTPGICTRYQYFFRKSYSYTIDTLLHKKKKKKSSRRHRSRATKTTSVQKKRNKTRGEKKTKTSQDGTKQNCNKKRKLMHPSAVVTVGHA